MLSNILLAAVLLVVNLLFASLTFVIGEWTEQNQLGLFNFTTVPVAVQLIASIVFLDFWAGYIAHVVFHKFEWLWTLHSVHHSDDLVDVTTTFRQHPIESIIRISFNLSAIVILGIPIWMLLVYLTLSTINAQFEHANIHLPYKLDKLLQYIIVTPNMHKVHHSKYQMETDSNYSNIFSFWDRMFGTYRTHPKYDEIDYGLDYLNSTRHFSVWDLLKLPFLTRFVNSRPRVVFKRTPGKEESESRMKIEDANLKSSM
jgi:sterol desaturase/sphingolipid hydroxylase (fatty acid hydroxylase superfamily)